MKTFMLDATGDISFVNSQLQMVNDTEEIVQAIRTVLRSNKKEWAINPNFGIDYLVLWQKHPNEDDIREQVFQAIWQVNRVDQATNLDIGFDKTKRELSISFEAKAKDGTELKVEVNEVAV